MIKTTFKASIDYFSLFPYESHGAFKKKLFSVPAPDRKIIWEGFTLPIEEIEKRFKLMTEERIRFAKRKRYSTYVDMILEEYQIPKKDYEILAKNEDELIKYCQENLPEVSKIPEWFYSKFNLPCYLCQLPSFPFASSNEVSEFLLHHHPLLAKFKNKITINLGESSRMIYRKETDTFEITIDKNNNIRHRTVDIVHELSHVINYLLSFEKEVSPLEKGAYWREKETIKIETEILKEVSSEMFKAFFGEILLLLHRVFFEIKLYDNPQQNLSKRYAQTFNKCFKGANQKSNPLYILDEHIVLNPLSTLPHAVAFANWYINNAQ